MFCFSSSSTTCLLCLYVSNFTFLVYLVLPTTFGWFTRYHFLNKDALDVLWLVNSLQHMVKMSLWAPHTFGLQNVRAVIQWCTHPSKQKKNTSTLLPTLLPVELVESLRARLHDLKKTSALDEQKFLSMLDQLSRAGIEVGNRTMELLR